MQTTSASMAWLFLQENEQVQYLQKIALRAENLSSPKYISITLRIEQIPQIICLVKQKSVKSGESVERKGTNNYFPRQRFSADY